MVVGSETAHCPTQAADSPAGGLCVSSYRIFDHEQNPEKKYSASTNKVLIHQLLRKSHLAIQTSVQTYLCRRHIRKTRPKHCLHAFLGLAVCPSAFLATIGAKVSRTQLVH